MMAGLMENLSRTYKHKFALVGFAGTETIELFTIFLDAVCEIL